jgi:cytochrome c oxidase subunit I+III
LPMFAGVGTAVFFLSLTVKLTIPATVGAVAALVSIFMWLWQTDIAPSHRTYDVGAGVKLPDYTSGASSHSWWAMVVLMLVDGSIFACLVFSFFYLWTVGPAGWPPGGMDLPLLGSSLFAALAWVLSGVALHVANRILTALQARLSFDALLLIAIAAMWIAVALNLHALSTPGIRPEAHAYGATAYTMLAWQGVHAALLTLMLGYTLARRWAGLLDRERRNTFDNTRIMGYFCAAQGLASLLVVHAPRLSG